MDTGLCCICELEDGGPVPRIMADDGDGKFVCQKCFVFWYDWGMTDSDAIRAKRWATPISKVGEAVIQVPMLPKVDLFECLKTA